MTTEADLIGVMTGKQDDFPPFAGIYSGDWIADRTRGEVRELRAEIERRQKSLDDCVACLADERVEIERLRAFKASYHEAEAENERLRATCATWNERDIAQAQEIERLRAALQQILEDPEARILDSHREDGWEALGPHKE